MNPRATPAAGTVAAATGAGAPTVAAAKPRRAFDLPSLFAPRSIAVVGASLRSGIATTVRDNIAHVRGTQPCWFVNPKYDEVDGTRCYPDLVALPEVPDTVVLAVNPLRAAQFTREAAAAGVKTVVIPGGGVVEGGEAAARMQAEVREVAIATGTAILGPNCMGMVDLTTSSATYIGDVSPWLRRGGVAGIAQSGSVSDTFIHAGTRIGWSRIVSCGSEVVLDLCDYLAYCLDDEATHAVVLFVEGFKRPELFLALADHALAIGKPILAVKVGSSAQARTSAVAHSGSLAGEDRIVDAALRASGVIRCADLDELLEAAELVAGTRRLGRSVGRGRTGVVTVSTGEASLIADLAPRTGVDLPPVPEATRARIHADLPTLGYIGNPMDPWGADDTQLAYGACLRAFVDSGAYDVVAVVHDFPFRSQAGEVELATELAAELAKATEDRPDVLPVFVSLTSGDATPEIQAALDAAGGIPLLRGTVEAFGSIARLAWWEGRRAERLADGPWRSGWPALATERTPYGDGAPAVTTPPVEAGRALPERESLELLRAAGIAVTRAIPAAGANEAVAAADGLGYPVALKIDAPTTAHKTDIGGVRLDLNNGDAVRAAVPELLAAGRAAGVTPRGVLVEPMAAPGTELIVGLERDPMFGPAVLVGSGGILAEILDDVAIRLAPLTRAAAQAMLDELRSAPILAGARGDQPVDRAALADIIVAVAQLGLDRPDIAEIDLNPVIASAGGAVAVDALVVLAADTAEAPMPDAAEPVLLQEATDWGVRLILNRPSKLNALSAELRDALTAAVAAAEADPGIRVIAIAGAGRAFCSGYDLSEQAPDDVWGWRAILAGDVAATLAIWRCSKPVIAQVHGFALAGGLELAMACDLVVASDDARLGEPEIRFGSAPVTLLMPFLIGQKATRELLMTGDLVDAAEARRMGLVNRVVPADRLAAEVDELAETLAKVEPDVMAPTKLMLNRAMEASGFLAAVEAGLDLQSIVNTSATARAFDEIVRRDGLKAALAWRDQRYQERLADRGR